MNCYKATNQQLLNILQHDNTCPSELLEPIVHESINRGLLKPIVIDAVKKAVGEVNDDYIQMGYMAVLNAIRTFKEGTAGFISCLYLPIKRMILTYLRNQKAQKRAAELISIETEIGEGITLGDTLPSHMNTERTAINRVLIDGLLAHSQPLDKYIIYKHHIGFTFAEIGTITGLSRQGVTKRYKNEIKRMRGVIA